MLLKNRMELVGNPSNDQLLGTVGSISPIKSGFFTLANLNTFLPPAEKPTTCKLLYF